MKRLISALFLLFLCFLISLYGWITVDKRSKELITFLEQAEKYIESDEIGEAELTVEKCNEKWERHETVFSVFIDHKLIEPISVAIPTIQSLVEDKNNSVALEKIEECVNTLKSLEENQRISIKTIF